MNLETLIQFMQFGGVFPLAGTSKKPMHKWDWTTMNTDDILVAEEWLEQFPTANWALVPIRAFVVDVDVKGGSDGPTSMDEAGGLTRTFSVRTPSGGTHHYYFAAPDELPFATRNQWLPGVDIRYGGDGYVVLPYSTTVDGRYEIIVDLDELPSCASHPSGSKSILSPVPEWVRTKWIAEIESVTHINSNKPLIEKYQNVTGQLSTVRDRIRYMFFRKGANLAVWNKQPLKTMKDTTKSGFEIQLAIRLMNVGATDEEVMTFYKAWCNKHLLRPKKTFATTTRRARSKTAAYVQDWQAKQPVRRKQGTTRAEITEAIETGACQPKDIAKATGSKGSAVRMMLSKMVADGSLVSTPSGYAIPCAVLASERFAEAA
ncbi:bifunctional DNA primase/polymerase [Paludibaculum fermentans]|uniref:bifunctional DNA primase/polymerase n=1 Tax=Paludibaculum fermentans TaxID=1473598 RepID=UPI003EBB1D10